MQPNQHTAVPFDLEEAKKVLGRHSCLAGAAAELGMSKKALSKRFLRRKLHASTFLARVPVPEGMQLKTLTIGPNGRTTKAELEAKIPPKAPMLPAGHHIKGVSSYFGPGGDMRAQWVKTSRDLARQEAEFLEAAKKATARYRGISGKAPAPKSNDRDSHVVIPIGDPHIGMLAWGPETGANFDVRIAERELYAVVEELVERAPPAETCTLINLGDYFHAEDNKQVTPTSGHKLDVDGRSAKVQQIGCNLTRRIVDCSLRRFRRVRMCNVPGNHDPNAARWLALWLQAVYEREPRVEIPPNFNPFFYWRFGKNMFGAMHGDGLKLRDLPGLMAAHEPKMWGATTHRFIHSGHVHHDHAIEEKGTMVYTWRTLAANDSWSHRSGYVSGKSLCAIEYAREGGEASRVSVDLGCVQRRIYAKG